MSYSYNNYYPSNNENYPSNNENSNYHPSDSTPPISNATNVVGKGTYGFILKPALSNRRPNGTIEEYPNNVTKAYFNKNSLNGAIKTGAKNIQPYRQ